MDKGKMDGYSIGIRLGLGMTGGLAATFAGAMLLAALVNGEVLEQRSISAGAGVILFASAAIGALLSGRKGGKKLLVAVMTGALYCLCLLCINALFFSGEYAGVPVSVLLALSASACAGILTSGKKSRGKYRRRKR